jgi:DNA-binding beta-propeller fold protein YncE
VPPAAPSILDIRPLWAVEGGRVALRGSDFPVDGPRLPEVRVGPLDARVVHASSTRISLVVPRAIEGGTTAVRLADQPGATAFLEVGRPIAVDLHQVDSPVFDPAGNLYVTISGRRDQQAPVSIFRLTPDGSREPLPVEIPSPTSMAVDRAGQVYVSSRFEGSVYRIVDDGHAELVSADLGSPCGLAVGPDGALYVGDRSGSILRIATDREVTELASLPPSMAAYHLAFGPDGCLYVSVPTLGSRDSVYRIAPDGRVSVVYGLFGRPQGLAFDERGDLYVVDALAGSAGLFRLDVDDPSAVAEQVLAAPELVGVAFDPNGGLVVASGETVYRIEVPLRPLTRPVLGV